MDGSRQLHPAGGGASGLDAAARLVEIQRRHGQVIKAVLVPIWYWWAMAAAVVAIGAARDSGDPPVQAGTIPLAALVIVGLTGAMIPGVRRRVQVHSATRPGARGAAAIIALIVLIDGVIIGVATGLSAQGFSYPGTVSALAGAVVLVVAGPLVNAYLSRLMLGRAGQNGAPEAGRAV